MPRYDYRCLECEVEFTVVHLMSEKLEKCPECEKLDTLQKVYSTIRKAVRNTKREKVGDKVKKHIEDAKKDVREEKDRLKKEEYKS